MGGLCLHGWARRLRESIGGLTELITRARVFDNIVAFRH
jgi:hypothetical protein